MERKNKDISLEVIREMGKIEGNRCDNRQCETYLYYQQCHNAIKLQSRKIE